jgi:hypothetical protein
VSTAPARLKHFAAAEGATLAAASEVVTGEPSCIWSMAWHTRLAQEVPAWAKRGEGIERRVSELHLSLSTWTP